VEIGEYDDVRLKDGREGTIVHIFAPGKSYSLDVGTTPETWDNISISHDQIAEVLRRATP
jgi:hypothetical protein